MNYVLLIHTTLSSHSTFCLNNPLPTNKIDTADTTRADLKAVYVFVTFFRFYSAAVALIVVFAAYTVVFVFSFFIVVFTAYTAVFVSYFFLAYTSVFLF